MRFPRRRSRCSSTSLLCHECSAIEGQDKSKPSDPLCEPCLGSLVLWKTQSTDPETVVCTPKSTTQIAWFVQVDCTVGDVFGNGLDRSSKTPGHSLSTVRRCLFDLPHPHQQGTTKDRSRTCKRCKRPGNHPATSQSRGASNYPYETHGTRRAAAMMSRCSTRAPCPPIRTRHGSSSAKLAQRLGDRADRAGRLGLSFFWETSPPVHRRKVRVAGHHGR
jgi:hypothetical protein